MTIDEAMKKIKEKMACDYNISGCDTCDISSCEDRSIIIQLAEWLEELKAYREIGTVEGYKSAIECYTEEYTRRKSNEQYNKALDDIKEKLMQNGFIYTQLALDVFNKIAEQLKEHNK